MGDLTALDELFKPVHTPFDAWDKQCYDGHTDYAGGKDVWAVLIAKWGKEARTPIFLRQQMGDFGAWVRTELDLPEEVLYYNPRRSFASQYGEEAFPLNILLWLNDEKKLTPEEFRTLWLQFAFEKEEEDAHRDK